MKEAESCNLIGFKDGEKAALGARKGKETDPSLGISRRNTACQHNDFIPMSPVSDF